MHDETTTPAYEGANTSPFKRFILLAIGWFFVAVGAIGVFLPVLPTTPFLIISLWAFSRSSRRFHHWLYTHRWYGPYLVAWDRYRVIPVQAKVMSVTFMAMGWSIYTYYLATSWTVPIIIATCEILVMFYILSKPSTAPTGD
jgi:uncharacterized protein